MKVVISSGHGLYVSGASSIINEVTEARKVVPKVVSYLRSAGVNTIEFHENSAKSAASNVNSIVAYHNSQVRDLDVSVHFNASQKTSNPVGVEVLYLTESTLAARVSKAISDASGLKNRGAKKRTNLAFLNNTKQPAILIEVCFVDSSADVSIYQNKFDAICKAIAEGIVGKSISSGNTSTNTTSTTTSSSTTKTQASAFVGLSSTNAAAKILELVKPNCISTGIFPSVKAAQMILESSYVTSELAKNANNCFGMKDSLSGNSWAGSTWDGKSVYTKKTAENKPDGTPYTVTANFRKYACIEDSIADHSAYLLGAKNGNALRYAGLSTAADYRAQITIIKNGGYATDVNYVSKVCDLIVKLGLDKYDKEVRQPASDLNEVYQVNVASALNCRSGAGTTFSAIGQFKPKEIVTATKKNNGWYYVTNGKITGWASGNYLVRLTVQGAIDKLTKEGIISSPATWLANYNKINYLERLIINMGYADKTAKAGTSIKTAEQAIDKLTAKGIISSPDYWKANYSKLAWLDLLLMNVANRL